MEGAEAVVRREDRASPRKGRREERAWITPVQSGVAASLCHRTPHNRRTRQGRAGVPRHLTHDTPFFNDIPPSGGQGLAMTRVFASLRTKCGNGVPVTAPARAHLIRRFGPLACSSWGLPGRLGGGLPSRFFTWLTANNSQVRVIGRTYSKNRASFIYNLYPVGDVPVVRTLLGNKSISDKKPLHMQGEGGIVIRSRFGR